MIPLVSIITPAFNAERFIAATAESVLKQTVIDWEMIISDDGSTDATVAIAEDLARRDSRIRVIKNPPAHHPGPTRNAAMAAARGKYFAFLDADDLWLPTKLEEQIAVMQKAASPGACYTLAEDFTEVGPPPVQSHMQPLRYPPERQYEETLLFCNGACTSSLMLEREFAEEIGPFTDVPMLGGYEDWDYFLRALYRRPLVFVPKVLVRYRVHPESISRRRKGQWERHFEIYRQAEARGELPRRLRDACYSSAWLVRGETELEAGDSHWRSSFLRSFKLDPFNWRRWPLLMALVLNRGAMVHSYEKLKSIQRSREVAAHSPEAVEDSGSD